MINGSGLQPTFLNVLGGIFGAWAGRQLFGGRRGGGQQQPQKQTPFWMENPQILIALAKAIEEIDRSRADYGKQFLSSLGILSDYDKQLGSQVNTLLTKTGGKR